MGPGNGAGAKGAGRSMGRILLKLLAVLVVIGALGITGFGYLGDLSPDQSDVSEPVILNAD